MKSRYGKNPDDYERYAVIAVTSIYGVDILHDNVDDCRNRMFEIFDKEYTAVCKKQVHDDTREAVRHILKHNILCGDSLRMTDTNGNLIVFAEWTAVNSHYLKRRDYVFEELVEQGEHTLFSGKEALVNDMGKAVFIPKAVAEFPPIHYRRVQEHE